MNPLSLLAAIGTLAVAACSDSLSPCSSSNAAELPSLTEAEEDVSSLLQTRLDTAFQRSQAAAGRQVASAPSNAAPSLGNNESAGQVQPCRTPVAVTHQAFTGSQELITNASKLASALPPCPDAAGQSVASGRPTGSVPASGRIPWAPEVLTGASVPSLHFVNATMGTIASTMVTEHHVVLFHGLSAWVMFLIGLFFPILAMLTYSIIGFIISRCLGAAIAGAIETFDKSTLGVDVIVGKLSVHPCKGLIKIEGVTFENPKGYKSEYLFSAKTLEVDFCMSSLILSGFKHVVVEKICLKRVDIIYEKTWSSSNVHDVLSFLEGHVHAPHLPSPPGEEKKLDATEKKQEDRNRNKKKSEGSTQVEARVVVIEDVGMRLQGQMIGGHGARLAVADMKYDDFSKEVGSAYMDDMIKLLLKSVLKTIVANVIGRRAAERCM